MPLAVGGRKQFTCVVKPVRQVREPSKGYEMKDSFHMQETVNWSSKLIPFRGRWWGTAPVNVRSVSEKHNAVWQADSGFGGRCSRKFSEAPLRPDSPLPVGPLNLMTFAMGGTPRAGSRHGFFTTEPSGKPPKVFNFLWFSSPALAL